MPIFEDRETGLSVRTKINNAINLIDGFTGQWVSDRAALLADTTLSYSGDTSLTVGGYIAVKDGTVFEVAASGATDHHEATAGGVKLYEAGSRYTSRARLADAVSRGVTWSNGTLVSDGDHVYMAQDGASVITDLVGLVLHSDVVPQAFVVNATPGTTDMSTGLAKALGYGSGDVLLDEVYSVTRTSGQSFSLFAGTGIRGAQGSRLDFTPAASGTTVAFSSTADVQFDNVDIAVTGASGSTTAQIWRCADGVVINGGIVDGNVVESGGAASYVMQAITFSSNDAENMTVSGVKFQDTGRVVLKSTASTATQQNIKFRDVVVDGYFSEAMAFNNPSGTFIGLSVNGSFHTNGYGIGLGTTNHAIGGANIQLFGAIDNVTYGTGGDHVHFEEGTRQAVALGNRGFFTDAERAFFSSDNDEGGAQTFTVSGVTLTGTNRVRVTLTGHGLESGEVMTFSSVGGTTELNSGNYTIRKIDANTVDLEGTSAADFTAWTSGGTGEVLHRPVRQVVVGDAVWTRDTIGGQAGIDIPDNGAGVWPMSTGIVHDAVLTGWDNGVRLHRPDILAVHDVTVSQGVTGVRTVHPSLSVRDITVIDCDEGIDFANGGAVGRVHFRTHAETWDGGRVFVPKPVVNGYAGAVGLHEWTLEHVGVTHAGALGQNYNLMPVGSRFHGEFHIWMVFSGSVYRMTKITPTWDGTTMSNNTSADAQYNVGSGLSFVDLREDSGNLAVRISSSVARSGVSLQIAFRGFYTR